jgi:PAS domain S-box-containing protein
MLPNEDLRQANAAVFESLLDWFPDMIHSVDSDGRIVYANRTASERLGYTPRELLGLPISRLYAPDIFDQVSRGFSELREKGQLFVCDSVLVDKNGARIPVEIRSFAVYDSQHRFVRSFSVLRDLSAIRKLQDDLMHASRLASIGELASGIVHDIANPLGVIRMSGELLQDELRQVPGADRTCGDLSLQASLATVEKATTQIQRLVDQLRNLARAHDTKAEMIDLRQSIEDALFMVKSKLMKRTVAVAEKLPEQPCWVWGHGGQLEQAFMNLFSNACDAMQDVSKPTLSVELRRADGPGGAPVAECIVCDNGCGIPPELKGKIFESFFTTKPAGQGTGLGLGIVQSIVHRHRGAIEVDSKVGEGATFRVRLPLLSQTNVAD